MSNYTKTTNFATKDNLSPGNPLKIVKGTEIDTEFNNIATAVATKTDNASAAITGGTITGITDLAVADGGTGASTAAGGLNNLLPTQTGNANKYLQTDGTNATWDAVTLSTADITGTLPVANGGTGVTSSTGTGNVVLSNSPTLVTPALGTPASGVATNLTGLPLTTGVTGTLPVANGGTGITSLGTGVATFLGTPSSANLLAAVTDETGTGSLVFATSPTLVTPALGTPSALVGTNITGTASGLTAGNVTTNANLTGAVTSVGNATSLGSFSSANLLGALTDETGTGSAVFATSPTLVTPILGTPTSATLTNATGLPLTTGVTGQLPVANGGTGTATPSIVAGTNVTVTGTWPNQTIAASGGGGSPGGSTTEVQYNNAGAFAGITGATSNGTALTLVAPVLGTPASATLTNATGLPISTGVSGLGTGVATALAVNVGSAGAAVVNGGALGTPSSGTATNLTGLPLTTGVTGTLPVANGGTGAATFTANNVLLGNGTSALQVVAPSTSGNVLTSNGTTWTSAAAASAFSIGDTLTTAQVLASPTWLPCDNSVYLQSSYTALYALLGIIRSYTTKVTDPATLPTGIGNKVAFSSDSTYLAMAHLTTPFVTIYKRAGDVFTKLANPATLPAGTGIGAAFSADTTYLAVGHSTTPFVTIYKRSGDTFTKLANPATLPPADVQGCAFSADGTYLSVSHITTPFVTIYKRSGDVFTKLADPATLPAGNGQCTEFSPDGTYLAVGHATTPFVTIYKRSGDTFTKLTNPATLPAASGQSTAFSPDGNYLSVAHGSTPFVTIYKRSGDTFTKLADPVTLPTGTARGAAYTADGKYLCVSHETSPYVTTYQQKGDVFIKQTNPTTLAAGDGRFVAFSANGTYQAVTLASTPFIIIYKDSVTYDTATQFATPNDSSAPVGTVTFIKAT